MSVDHTRGNRSWEKELILGASDEELSKALGACWSSSPNLEIHCSTDSDPLIICTTSSANRALVRMLHP